MRRRRRRRRKRRRKRSGTSWMRLVESRLFHLVARRCPFVGGGVKVANREIDCFYASHKST